MLITPVFALILKFFYCDNHCHYRFGGAGYALLSCKQNARDMLRSISWGQFTEFMLMATGIYYFYVIARYYRKEITAFFFGSHGRAPAPDSGKVEGKVVAMPELSAGKEGMSQRGNDLPGLSQGNPPGHLPEVEQADLFEAREGFPDQSSELFKAMDIVITLLKEVVSQGVADGINREELTDHIREVLASYHQLKQSPYQEAINSFLIRTCSTNFSLVLEGADLDVLWS